MKVESEGYFIRVDLDWVVGGVDADLGLPGKEVAETNYKAFCAGVLKMHSPIFVAKEDFFICTFFFQHICALNPSILLSNTFAEK